MTLHKSEKIFESLINVENLESYSKDDAIKFIGSLVDVSSELKKIQGLEKAIAISGELFAQDLTSQQLSLLYYFLGNAWSSLKVLRRHKSFKLWDYQQEEIENEIINLRKALKEDGFEKLSTQEKCSILTDLGNAMDYIGRFVEAIEYWDQALQIDSSFGMASGNKGIGFTYYSGILYDDGHEVCPRVIFYRIAHANLELGLRSELYEDARKRFNDIKMRIESRYPPEDLKKNLDLDNYSLGISKSEQQYRKWCLVNRLFINPLNDLGPYPIAARDSFAPPAIVTKIKKEEDYLGFFNQVKQEFVSARYMYYDGIKSMNPHFSDKEVRLFNTLDYPAYSLSIEKIKMAFRVIYSIFDKIAYFLNNYLKLGIQNNRVNFKTLWYESQELKKGLRQEFRQNRNWPLRGLFWLSKDLYENKPAFKESMLPDAQEIYEIRNHLEHKYLKIRNEMFSEMPNASNFTYSAYRSDFESKTLRLIKMARASLIYIFTAVNFEEQTRSKKREKGAHIMRLPRTEFDDNWKR